MSKLTKAQNKEHLKAVDILKKEILSEDEVEFVYRNWHEGAEHNNSLSGAFFTPFDMAMDFALDVGGKRIIDLCAGIGMLTYATQMRNWYEKDNLEFICVEKNQDYVDIGKKLVPEATWICADVFDILDINLGKFDTAISNPPFGNVKRSKNSPRYSGKDFEYHVIDIASNLADFGVFIVPQMSAGFNYSGRPYYDRHKDGKAVKFQEQTGLHFEAGCGVDTSIFKDEWKGVSPICEIVCVEF
jgi:type I restriction-modification system DNA methylase subunit